MIVTALEVASDSNLMWGRLEVPTMAKAKDLTLKQVAEHFGVSLSTVKQWHRDKGFPNAYLEETVIGPVWLIPMSDVKNFKRPSIGRPTGKKAAPKK